jgi:hypothetical protein
MLKTVIEKSKNVYLIFLINFFIVLATCQEIFYRLIREKSLEVAIRYSDFLDYFSSVLWEVRFAIVLFLIIQTTFDYKFMVEYLGRKWSYYIAFKVVAIAILLGVSFLS